MHKDQTRVIDALVPRLEALVVSDEESAVRDCTVLNRLFLQGPDPLYLMEACPRAFEFLCLWIGLSVEEGREAIVSAHERGPAVLLDEEGGIPFTFDEIYEGWLAHPAWTREALWLLLASFSDCTEEEYSPSLTLLERIQRATAAAVKFEKYARDWCTAWCFDAHAVMTRYDETNIVMMDDKGIPHYTNDIGFYLAYKMGYRVCAYDTPKGLTFYGTIPGTSLDAEGVVVDKKVSDTYGIVFPPEGA